MAKPRWRCRAALVLAPGLLAGCNEAQNKFVALPPPAVGVSVPLQRAVTPYLDRLILLVTLKVPETLQPVRLEQYPI